MDTPVPLQWHTEKRKINDIKAFDKNPRKLTAEQKEHLTASLKKFNLVEIPAIDVDGVLIAGHQRVSIMKALGRGGEEIDCRVPNRKLTEEEFKEYNLRSNKNTGSWVNELLAEFGEDMLSGVGFSASEIAGIIGDEDIEGEVKFTEELNEEHNFVVLYFDNSVDWLQAQTLLGLEEVRALHSKPGFEAKGIGRVLKGVDAINKIRGAL